MVPSVGFASACFTMSYAGYEGCLFVAKKPIAKGKELIYSYGPVYWKIKKERENSTMCAWKDLVKARARYVTTNYGQGNVWSIVNEYRTEGDGMDDYTCRYQQACMLGPIFFGSNNIEDINEGFYLEIGGAM